MFREILDNDDLVALRLAYEKACEELHLGVDDGDKGRRERLAVLMLSLAKGGECDPDVIRTQAVHQMRSSAIPAEQPSVSVPLDHGQSLQR
jgi:hypothetical protein